MKTAEAIEMLARVLGEPGNDDDLTMAVRGLGVRIESAGKAIRDGLSDLASAIREQGPIKDRP